MLSNEEIQNRFEAARKLMIDACIILDSIAEGEAPNRAWERADWISFNMNRVMWKMVSEIAVIEVSSYEPRG